jgi:hypothetical protein
VCLCESKEVRKRERERKREENTNVFIIDFGTWIKRDTTNAMVSECSFS